MEVDEQRTCVVLGRFSCFGYENGRLERSVAEGLVDDISPLESLNLVGHLRCRSRSRDRKVVCRCR
jgi:hypothetical protein